MTSASPPDDTLRYAREVIEHEARAVASLAARLDSRFARAVEMILACRGRVVVTGMGKPGLVGQKISATLASTGSPSLSLHPAEAIHGDLGRVVKDDVLLMLSNSGETKEIVRLIDPVKRIGAPIIAITGDASSTLARHADVLLDMGKMDEACPMGLAPSTTTTAMLAMGDALSLAVLRRRGFGPEDYALFHPGGSLGRKLLKVEEVMRTGARHPVIGEERSVKEALFAITEARAGAITAVDATGRIAGIFTDGDLRRSITRGIDLEATPLRSVMTKKPITIQAGRLASEALRLLRERKIDEMPVVDDGDRPVGMVDVQDLLDVGLVPG